MPVKVLSLAAILVATQLSGCAYLHHAEHDKTAREAKQAFADVKLGNALVAERAALTQQQAERQALVRRSQTSLRDTRLAAILSDDKDGWSNLTSYAKARIATLAGSPEAAPKDCHDKLGELQRSLNAAEKTAEANKGNVQLLLALAGKETLPLSCGKQPTVIPEKFSAVPKLRLLVGAYDGDCSSVNRWQACIARFHGAGMLRDIRTQLDEVATAQTDTSTLVDTQQKAYAQLRKDAASAAAQPGEAEALSQRLKNIVAPLENPKLNDKLKNNVILKHLGSEALIESLQIKKELINDYLDALVAGTADSKPADEDQRLKRLRLVSDVVNHATGTAPPVTGMLMQAEYYRLQIEGEQKRLARAEENVALLKRKQLYLSAELANLQQLDALLKEAQQAKCTDQALVAGLEGKEPACRSLAADALIQFSMAWTLGRTPAEQTDYLVIDLHERAVLDESETALKQTEAVYSAALDEVVRVHAGGLTAEQIAAFLQAAGLGAIAVRVK